MTMQELKALRAAGRLILDKIAEDGVVKIPGFGRFEVKEISYRNPTTGDKERTRVLRFYPFSGAKYIAKHGKTSWVKTTKRDHSKPLAEPRKLSGKDTARPMAKVTPQAPPKPKQMLAPGEYEGSIPKVESIGESKKVQPPKKGGFSFSLGGPRNSKA